MEGGKLGHEMEETVLGVKKKKLGQPVGSMALRGRWTVLQGRRSLTSF